MTSVAHGEVVYKDDKFVVRVHRSLQKKEIIVKVHDVRNGQEYLPDGYGHGVNLLIVGEKK